MWMPVCVHVYSYTVYTYDEEQDRRWHDIETSDLSHVTIVANGDSTQDPCSWSAQYDGKSLKRKLTRFQEGVSDFFLTQLVVLDTRYDTFWWCGDFDCRIANIVDAMREYLFDK